MAASGPSLPLLVDEACASGLPTIAVNDAYRIMPWADVLYACDEHWWDHHEGARNFRGEKWSSHEQGDQHANDKRAAAEKYGLHLVRGSDGDGFSFDPSLIHYGSNSGFQAVNLAILFGCKRIVLIGFDMRRIDGRAHFFGEHPKPLFDGTDYSRFLSPFKRAARTLPSTISIVNATPDSDLRCFPMKILSDAIDDYMRGDRAEPHAAAG